MSINTTPTAPITSAEAPLWRSLEELLETPGYQDMLHREFPSQAGEWTDPVSRRSFLSLMGASLALAGLSGCRQPSGTIVPNVREADGSQPGLPLYFASAMTLSGYATPVLVKNYEGRPIKIEANTTHPSFKGENPDSNPGVDMFALASILGMYDPDRQFAPNNKGAAQTWEDAFRSLNTRISELKKAGKGASVRLLTGQITSPTLASSIGRFLKEVPNARWHQYEPLANDPNYVGTALAYGKPLETVHQIHGKGVRAEVIATFDCDLLYQGPAALALVRQYSELRDITKSEEMTRLYAIESALSVTGAKADHRLAAKPSEIPALVQHLAAILGVVGGTEQTSLSADQAAFIKALAADLLQSTHTNGKKLEKPVARKATLVAVGIGQPPEVHALVAAINEKLGNTGKTVRYLEPLAQHRPLATTESLAVLAADIKADKVDLLLVIDTNPVYSATGDIDFKSVLESMSLKPGKTTVAVAQYEDETAIQCQWRLPLAHYLEQWGDALTYDGRAVIIQPMIAPLYHGKSAEEFLAGLTAHESDPMATAGSSSEREGHDLVKSHWKNWYESARGTSPDLLKFKTFDEFYTKSLHDGYVHGYTTKEQTGLKLTDEVAKIARAATPKTSGSGLEVVFTQDDTVYDGRFGNNGWLQETPKPITKITWDNAAYINYATAKALGMKLAKENKLPGLSEREYVAPAKEFGTTAGEHGRAYVDVLDITVDGKTVSIPAWVVPGVADNTIVLQLGYGRTRAGRVGGHLIGKAKAEPSKVGNGKAGDVVGVNVNAIRTQDSLFSARSATAKVNGRTHLLACTQGHHSMEAEGRAAPLVRVATVATNASNPHWVEHDPSLAGHKGDKATDSHAKKDDHKGHDHGHDHKEESHGHGKAIPLTLLPNADDNNPMEGYEYAEKVHRWGMVIDLNRCTGCSACVVACQSENNSPIVGKHEVSRGREMHWIRVDRYFQVTYHDTLENPSKVRTYHQPVPCMQCENAPCEQVCPVAATVHSYDGLNDMVYNRCVGTRYCSNNCPYKVRRFNFLQYTDYTTPSLKLMNNPEVTIRTRGVMEKCTYCVQRIRHAEIEAEKRTVKQAGAEKKSITRKKDGEPGKLTARINDGEVVTACMGACPANAIVFGDMNDPKSRIARLKSAAKHLNYTILEGLNTFPRTTYLAGLRNPNPNIESAQG